ncbi:MAG: FtsW/RodA/SpoVE family cell cycle protein [Phycisphaerales bacterium]|nr:FtsW/RodA/SpoVE family cell cycle protein [Phycisphaerales bacterium]
MSTQRRSLARRLARWHWGTPAWLTVGAALILSLVGLIAIATVRPDLVLRQTVALIVGLGAAGLVVLPSHKRLDMIAWPLMGLCLFMLLFLLIPGVPESIVRPRNGATRWIDLGVTEMQPSELAKVAVVLAIASWLRLRRNQRSFTGLLPPLLLALVPMGLILVEPDLGTALLFLPICFAMLVAAGARWRDLGKICLLGLAGAALMIPLLRPHQVDRLEAMWAQIRGDTSLADSSGYQGQLAMTMVAAGGVAGQGGSQAADLLKWNHLPEDHNDMVFAVIALRWGLIGQVVLWSLYLLLVVGGLLTAATCREAFGRLIAVGGSALLFAQMVVNTGMTIGVMPITGMTLPFVSAGGSSLVTAWLLVGLVLNVGLRPPSRLWREQFAFDDGGGHG